MAKTRIGPMRMGRTRTTRMEMNQVKEEGESLSDNFELENSWSEREQRRGEKYQFHSLNNRVENITKLQYFTSTDKILLSHEGVVTFLLKEWFVG